MRVTTSAGYRAEDKALGCLVTAYTPATKSRPFLDCLVDSLEDMSRVLRASDEK